VPLDPARMPLDPVRPTLTLTFARSPAGTTQSDEGARSSGALIQNATVFGPLVFIPTIGTGTGAIGVTIGGP
jgi:hypothetical protein